MDQEPVELPQRGSSPEVANAIKLGKMFAESYIEVFQKMNIGPDKFTLSPSFYLIQNAQTRHRVSSLIDFSGGINGLIVINYPEEAAIDVVSAFLQGMGMGPEDCPKSIGEDVINTMGEICNQVVGLFRRNLEKRYGFSATSGTPITMLVNTGIILAPVANGYSHNYIRAQINSPRHKPFFVEFCVQEGVFIKLKG